MDIERIVERILGKDELDRLAALQDARTNGMAVVKAVMARERHEWPWFLPADVLEPGELLDFAEIQDDFEGYSYVSHSVASLPTPLWNTLFRDPSRRHQALYWRFCTATDYLEPLPVEVAESAWPIARIEPDTRVQFALWLVRSGIRNASLRRAISEGMERALVSDGDLGEEAGVLAGLECARLLENPDPTLRCLVLKTLDVQWLHVNRRAADVVAELGWPVSDQLQAMKERWSSFDDPSAPYANGYVRALMVSAASAALWRLGVTPTEQAQCILSALDSAGVGEALVIESLGTVAKVRDDALELLVELLDHEGGILTDIAGHAASTLGRLGPRAHVALPRLREMGSRSAAVVSIRAIAGDHACRPFARRLVPDELRTAEGWAAWLHLGEPSPEDVASALTLPATKSFFLIRLIAEDPVHTFVPTLLQSGPPGSAEVAWRAMGQQFWDFV